MNSFLADPFQTEGRELAVRVHFRSTKPPYSKARPTLSCQRRLKSLLIGLDPVSNPVISRCRPAYQAFQIGPCSEGHSADRCSGHSAVTVWKMAVLKKPSGIAQQRVLLKPAYGYCCLIWELSNIYPGKETWRAARRSGAVPETFYTLVLKIDSLSDLFIYLFIVIRI